MSVMGHFAGGSVELRTGSRGCDLAGLRAEGAVLRGKKSIVQAVQDAAVASVVEEGTREYARVEDYDVVLRWHCRM